jgi:hypothetical protein
MPEGCCGRVGVTLILISCNEAECWAYMKLSEIRGLGMSMTTGAAVLRQMRMAMLALAFALVDFHQSHLPRCPPGMRTASVRRSAAVGK